MFKQEKGITLVSLVITIIIMLILAGVSLSMVMGDGSLLEQANTAVDNTELGTVKDEIGVAIAGAQTNYYASFANTTRSTLIDELIGLSASEFGSANSVTIHYPDDKDVSATDDTKLYYTASSGKIYEATLDVTDNTIKVVKVEVVAAIPTVPSGTTAKTLS